MKFIIALGLVSVVCAIACIGQASAGGIDPPDDCEDVCEQGLASDCGLQLPGSCRCCFFGLFGNCTLECQQRLPGSTRVLTLNDLICVCSVPFIPPFDDK